MEQLSIFEEEHPPRFRAYLKYMNKTHASEVNVGNFMIWLHNNLNEFKKINRLRKFEKMTNKQDDLFTDYLIERSKEIGCCRKNER